MLDATTKSGYDNVLGIIDLATKHLMFIPARGRHAAAVCHELLYEVIARRGCPLLIHSDHAREFISKAMTQLTSIIGCSTTTTKGHNPQANATMERCWQFLNKCIRQMSKSQYDNIHLYLPLITACWNQTPNAITGISPFEAEHGMKARTIIDALNSNDLDQGMSATSEDLATIMTSVTAFNKIAARIQAIHKTQTALLLSKSGIPGKPYEVGSKVSFYKPPTAADVMKAGRKAKHLTQFHGPATITESLSNNGTTCIQIRI